MVDFLLDISDIKYGCPSFDQPINWPQSSTQKSKSYITCMMHCIATTLRGMFHGPPDISILHIMQKYGVIYNITQIDNTVVGIMNVLHTSCVPFPWPSLG